MYWSCDTFYWCLCYYSFTSFIVPFLIVPFLISTATFPISFYIWVEYSDMSREGVVTRESLLFVTYRTSDSLLAVIVNSVFVPCKIIRPREDRITGLIG